MVATKQSKAYAAKVVARLKKAYPEAWCALRYKNPLELLVATILSAQCTDERVNIVTEGLFKKYRTAEAYAGASLPELEREIQSTGFFRNKARSLQGAGQRLMEEHGGEVPKELEQLVELPGVGRKTANVVLGTAYGIASGVVVDTHVGRLSRRLGLTSHTDPEKVERDLMELLPRKEWVDFSHRLIHHGRQVCTARKAMCDRCTLVDICPKIGVANPPAAETRTDPRRRGPRREE